MFTLDGKASGISLKQFGSEIDDSSIRKKVSETCRLLCLDERCKVASDEMIRCELCETEEYVFFFYIYFFLFLFEKCVYRTNYNEENTRPTNHEFCKTKNCFLWQI